MDRVSRRAVRPHDFAGCWTTLLLYQVPTAVQRRHQTCALWPSTPHILSHIPSADRTERSERTKITKQHHTRNHFAMELWVEDQLGRAYPTSRTGVWASAVPVTVAPYHSRTLTHPYCVRAAPEHALTDPLQSGGQMLGPPSNTPINFLIRKSLASREPRNKTSPTPWTTQALITVTAHPSVVAIDLTAKPTYTATSTVCPTTTAQTPRVTESTAQLPNTRTISGLETLGTSSLPPNESQAAERQAVPLLHGTSTIVKDGHNLAAGLLDLSCLFVRYIPGDLRSAHRQHTRMNPPTGKKASSGVGALSSSVVTRRPTIFWMSSSISA